MSAHWNPATDRTTPPAAFGLTDEQATEPLSITRLEFDVLWETLGLGEMPLVLKVPSPGRTHAERRQLTENAWHAMETRGLGRGSAEYDRLVGLVRLLARPEREIDGRLWFGRRIGNLRALVAASGSDAALATLDPAGFTLREAAATGLAREALTALPASAAGSGESVTVPSRHLEAAAASASTPVEFETALRNGGVRPRDAATLAAMMMRIRRHGQFGVATRDRWGHRVRAPRVLSVFDTREGRYLQTRTTDPNTEPWTTVSPADPRLLLHQLDDLLNDQPH
ncbi:MAG TPA: ESX secretion-associated protein EspG [Pseudonocardiaceae bacterium]|jgi:hypothetical protein|nr:ESX secretion-associated protein EspG [Pseudonocardiaceae bacterium]